MAMGPNVLNLLMGCLVILASVSDIATKTIPNWITLSGMATAVMVHTAMRGAEGCLFSLGGIAVGISLLLPVYVFGGIGAGDVKLLGAIGGIVGPRDVLGVFAIACLVGGLYGVTVLLRHQGLKKTFLVLLDRVHVRYKNAERSAADLSPPTLRYGPVLAVGALAVWYWR